MHNTALINCIKQTAVNTLTVALTPLHQTSHALVDLVAKIVSKIVPQLLSMMTFLLQN